MPTLLQIDSSPLDTSISRELTREFVKTWQAAHPSADEYVIGVAMHNFSIPSVLKLWIDQVARRGRTFAYGANGPQGLLRGKKATVLVASGGVYEAGTPMGALNFIDPYLRAVFGFLGVSDVTFVTAGGAAQLMTGAIDRATFLKPTLDAVRTVAA